MAFPLMILNTSGREDTGGRRTGVSLLSRDTRQLEQATKTVKASL